MKIKLNSNLKNIIMLLITIIIFAILFTKINFFETINILKKTKLSLFLLAILISIISNIFIGAHKWFLIVKELNKNIPFKEMLFVRIGCYPLLILLPIKSGELLKAVYLNKKKYMSFEKGTSSLLFNALIDVFALVILFATGILVTHTYLLNLIYPYLIIFFISSLIYTLWKIEKTRKIISNFFKKINNKFHNIVQEIMISFEKISLKKTFLFVIYAIVFNLFSVLICYMLFSSLNVAVPFKAILIFMPLVILIGQIPITVSGFGTRETAIIFFFSKFANAETLLSAGILISFVNYLLPALLGLFFVKSFMKSL